MFFKRLITGPPRYQPEPAGSLLRVAGTTIVIFAGAQAAAAGFAYLAVRLAPAGGGGLPGAGLAGYLMTLTLVSQATILLLTLAAVRRAGLVRSLKLGMPAGGARTLWLAVALMVPLLAAFNGIAYLIAPRHMAQDFQQILELARSEAFPQTALAIGLGAPVSEELLFRGYLLPAITATVLGFWPAALVTCLSWTLLHLNYSIVGLAEVFLIGLYFSWLLWRTDSLVPALVCHAAYNTCLLLALRFGPF